MIVFAERGASHGLGCPFLVAAIQRAAAPSLSLILQRLDLPAKGGGWRKENASGSAAGMTALAPNLLVRLAALVPIFLLAAPAAVVGRVPAIVLG